MRNDIERFNKFAFHYVILDESQAIKNPTAKLTKAVPDHHLFDCVIHQLL